MAKKKDDNILLTGIFLGLAGMAVKSVFFGSRTQKLTSDFYTIEDVQRSETALTDGIKEQFLPLSPQILKNANFYAVNFLDPVTRLLGSKPELDSWWRSKRLNEEVGGVSTSWHLLALATDLDYYEGNALNNKKLIKAILLSELPYTKLIVYGSVSKPTGIHVSLNPDDMQRKELLLKSSSGDYSALTRNQLLGAYAQVGM